LKRITIFSKGLKLKIKTMRTKLKKYYIINLNCRKKNKKPIKLLQKVKEKKKK
jgi:hypothetical protein